MDKDAIAWLRADIARLRQELAAGTCRSRTFNMTEIRLQQRRLDFMVEIYG